MAQIEEIIIRIVGDPSKLKPTIELLKQIGVIVDKDAKTFKSAHDKMQRELGETGKKAQEFGRKSSQSAKKATTAFSDLSKRVVQLGSAMIGAFAIQQIITKTINAIKGFEKALSELSAITGAVGDDLAFLENEAKKIGRTTTISATEAVTAFKLMASAKPELLAAKESLASVTKQAILLAEASGQDLPTAITNLGNTLNAMELSASEAGRVVNVLAAASKLGAKEVPFITAALSKFGGVAESAGVSIETSAAAIEILGAKIPQAETVGVGLRNVLLELQTAAQAQGREFLGLGKELDLLAPRINDITFLEKSFGKENILVAQTLIKQRDNLKSLTEAITGTNTAEEQAIINTSNLDGALKRLDNAFEGAALQGGAFGDILTLVVEDAALGINKLSGETEETIDKFSVLGTILKAVRANFMFIIVPIREIFKLFSLLASNLREKFSPTIERIGNFFNRTIVPVFTTFRDVLLSTVRTLFAFGEAVLSKVGININLSRKAVELLNEILGNTVDEAKDATSSVSGLAGSLGTEPGGLTDVVKKLLTPIDALSKRISELNKELLNQALAGGIAAETMDEYKEAIQKAKDAQIALRGAMLDVLPMMDAQALKMEELGEGPQIFDDDDLTRVEKFFEKHGEGIDTAIKAEQTLARIVSQLNKNRLINIDNEEFRALKSLESQGLGEEQLADKRLQIQQRADQERRIILTNQAKAAKAAALFEATIALAVAITEVLGAGPVAVAAVAILGAAEIAVIAAQPIPEFHKGKKSELKEGEMYAKVLKAETIIPPEQSKRHKGLLDAVIDKNLEPYIMKQYTLPMLQNMATGKGSTPFDDYRLWSNQTKQMKLTSETNSLLRTLARSMDSGNGRRSWS